MRSAWSRITLMNVSRFLLTDTISVHAIIEYDAMYSRRRLALFLARNNALVRGAKTALASICVAFELAADFETLAPRAGPLHARVGFALPVSLRSTATQFGICRIVVRGLERTLSPRRRG